MNRSRNALAAFCLLAAASLHAQAPLKLVQVIALPEVKGRMDHLTVDAKRRRVIVSALGSDAVHVVNAFAGRVETRLSGLSLPQGSLYVPSLDKLFVANSASGRISVFAGPDYIPQGAIDFHENPDNLRFDPATNRVWVGYGEGALGAFDARTNQRLDINYPLGEHPEGFQLERAGPQYLRERRQEARNRRHQPHHRSHHPLAPRQCRHELPHGPR